MSLIHHLWKRETKRNETIICLVSGRMRFFVLHTYTFIVIGKMLYSTCTHDVYTGRDPQIPEIPKKAEYLK